MKITFRPSKPDDIPFILSCEADPEARPFIHAWSADQHRAAMLDPDCLHVLLVDVRCQREVGFAMLFGRQSAHHSVELRRIVCAVKGQGLGRAAIEALKQMVFGEWRAHRLWLDVKKSNARARHVYHAAGFEEESGQRDGLLDAGQDESLVVMSMLRHENSDPLAVSRQTLANLQIRPTTQGDAAVLAGLVAAANQDVARLFRLDRQNCPKHPSFCEPAWILSDMARGERYFLALMVEEPVGCVATEYPNERVAYLNRLVVLPAYRRNGIGAQLTWHVMALAREHGASTFSIGVIGEHTPSQRWYQALGFVPGELKRFEHLPFSVRYMACQIRTDEPSW